MSLTDAQLIEAGLQKYATAGRFAAALGVDVERIYDWRHRKKIPPKHRVKPEVRSVLDELEAEDERQQRTGMLRAPTSPTHKGADMDPDHVRLLADLANDPETYNAIMLIIAKLVAARAMATPLRVVSGRRGQTRSGPTESVRPGQ